jgi:hypothetical protein
MQKYSKMQIFGTIIMAVVFSWSWAVASDWKKTSEANGIIGYTRSTKESRFEAVKAVGTVDAPVAVVEAVLRDVPANTGFVFRCKKSAFVNTPEYKNTTDCFYSYMITAMPYPLKDRDAVCFVEYTIEKSTGMIYVKIKGIKTNYKFSKDMVRIPMLKADYVLTPKGPDRTEVTFMSIGEPGGSIPNYIVDMFSKNLGIETIAGLRVMARKDKYKYIRKVVTNTSHS